MTVEYAANGLIGVLTPQTNTTVEPEFRIMLPPGVATICARMTSAAGSLDARQAEYLDRLDETIAQFGNAPLGAIAVATTGVSYVAGAAREPEIIGAASGRAGAPVITAAGAIVSALRTLGAGKIGLVSPYPESLTRKSVAYWVASGFVVGDVVQMGTRSGSFHPIYTLSAADAGAALNELKSNDLDAVILLGTGMPTLGAILRHPRVGKAPLLSATLCLGWAAIDAAQCRPAERQSLLQFMRGEEWGTRLAATEAAANGRE